MMGDKIAGQAGRQGARHSDRPGLRRRGHQRPRREDRQGDRLSGADQGGGRRRRPRHEGCAYGRPISACALSTARAEAKAAFGNDQRLHGEISRQKPRHIEIQVFGDGHGNVMHLGERDCSLQRRHQKIWEEAPSPALNAEARSKIGETVADGPAQDSAISAPAPSNSSTRTASSISSR